MEFRTTDKAADLIDFIKEIAAINRGHLWPPAVTVTTGYAAFLQRTRLVW
jgi:hypothetical protein